nr:putative monosaccharide biosynthesis protein [Vibrio mimicus]
MNEFRYDINFLRFLAVTSVLIYHFNPNLMPTGFFGVDIFFVISGYLMTGIIGRLIKSKSFSLQRFIFNRSVRILPPLFFTVLLTSLFAFFAFNPEYYQNHLKHAAASLLFVSNHIYFGESGYFDETSKTKWLLHTWSLSAEWQFYIIYPIVVMLFIKSRWCNDLHSFRNLVVILFLTSIALFFLSDSGSKGRYFLIYSRAWEMMLGAIAFFVKFNFSDSIKKLITNLSITLILIFIFIDNKFDALWPNVLTIIFLLPVVLLIVVGNNDFSLYKNRVIQYIGRSSYSIYLLHWPVVLFVGSHYGLDSIMGVVVFMTILSILSFFQYFGVEVAFSNYIRPSRIRCVTAIAIYFIFIISLSSLWVFKPGENFVYLENPKFYSEIRNSVKDWFYPQPNYHDGHEFRNIIINDDFENVLFVGDSLMEQYYPRLEAIKNNMNFNVWFLTSSGCAPNEIITRSNWDCSNVKDVISVIDKYKFSRVVVSSYLNGYLKESDSEFYVLGGGRRISLNTPEGREVFYSNLYHFFKEIDERSSLYVIMPNPESKKFNPRNFFIDNNQVYSVGDYNVENNEYISFLNDSSEKLGFELLDPKIHLCTQIYCSVSNGNGAPKYKDNLHLRASFVSKEMSFIDKTVQ